MKVTKEKRFNNQKALLESIGFGKPDYVDNMFRIFEISDDVELWFGFEEESGDVFLLEQTFLHFDANSNLSTFKRIVKDILEHYGEGKQKEKRDLILTATSLDKGDESNTDIQQHVKFLKSLGCDSYGDDTVLKYELFNKNELVFYFYNSDRIIRIIEEEFIWGSDPIEDDEEFLEIATNLVEERKQIHAERVSNRMDNSKVISIKHVNQEDGINIQFVVENGKSSSLAALTFTLVESFLQDVLPKTVLNYLNPHFKRARSLLDKLQSTHFGRWYEKIRILPRGQALKPAAVKQEVLETVYQALMQERQFEARYRTKGADETKKYVIHPLGMVFRHEIIYLVCSLWNYKDIKQMALHRFESAELLEQLRETPSKFNLDDYIGDGGFSYPVNETPIKLQALFESDAAAHLFETPLSDDQTLTQKKEGKIFLKATVKDTSELQWWLLGFGDQVEVIKPKKLRDEFAAKIEKLSRMYKLK